MEFSGDGALASENEVQGQPVKQKSTVHVAGPGPTATVPVATAAQNAAGIQSQNIESPDSASAPAPGIQRQKAKPSCTKVMFTYGPDGKSPYPRVQVVKITNLEHMKSSKVFAAKISSDMYAAYLADREKRRQEGMAREKLREMAIREIMPPPAEVKPETPPTPPQAPPTMNIERPAPRSWMIPGPSPSSSQSQNRRNNRNSKKVETQTKPAQSTFEKKENQNPEPPMPVLTPAFLEGSKTLNQAVQQRSDGRTDLRGGPAKSAELVTNLPYNDEEPYSFSDDIYVPECLDDVNSPFYDVFDDPLPELQLGPEDFL